MTPSHFNKTKQSPKNRQTLVSDHMSPAHGTMANLRFNPSSRRVGFLLKRIITEHTVGQRQLVGKL